LDRVESLATASGPPLGFDFFFHRCIYLALTGKVEKAKEKLKELLEEEQHPVVKVALDSLGK
jgi:hypothetical protein